MDYVVWGILYVGNGFLWRFGCFFFIIVDIFFNIGYGVLVGLGCIFVLVLIFFFIFIKRGEGGYIFL